MLRLGVVADLHGSIGKAKRIADEFEGKIDALAIAGDILRIGSPLAGRGVLRQFKELKIPKYIIPGNYETVDTYQAIMKDFLDFYDCTKYKNRFKDIKGYRLIFLPGTEVAVGSGRFRFFKEKKDLEKFKNQIGEAMVSRAREFSPKVFEEMEIGRESFVLEEIKKYVEDPDKTLIISHMPPKFEGERTIDRAEFFIVEGDKMKNSKDNVGSKALREFIEETGIKKLACGHIHEAGGIANRLDGSYVEEGVFFRELFYNVGAGAEGKAGIITLKGNKAKYEKTKV